MTHQIRVSTRPVDSYQMELRHSFILDIGADGHVCNNREKFLTYTVAQKLEIVMAGNDCVDILG